MVKPAESDVPAMAGRDEGKPKDTKWESSLLSWVETLIAAIIGIAFLVSALFLAIWVALGYHQSGGIHERLERVVKDLSDNWKFGWVVLIALFFRPIREFLVHLKKGPLGMESERPMSSGEPIEKDETG